MKNWTQQDLVLKTNLAVPTIANIETKKQKPNQKTLEKIKAALEKAGIEFIGVDGIRKKKSSVKVLRGPQAFMTFFSQYVYEYARKEGGAIYLANAKERFYTKWFPDFYSNDYFNNMVKIRDRLDFRITLKEGEAGFSAN
jgi:transcriptional regulator with XRE-family HTH domain